MKKILCLLYLLSIFCFSHAQNENTYLEQKIDSTLSGMTIREKAGQLNQLDGRGTIENLKILIRKGEIGSVMNVTDPKSSMSYKKSPTNNQEPVSPWFSHARRAWFQNNVTHSIRTSCHLPSGTDTERGTNRSHRSQEHGVRWSLHP